MKLKDMNFYELAYCFFGPSDLFTKDAEKKKRFNIIIRSISDDVFRPNLTVDGLKIRESTILSVALALGIFSILSLLLLTLPFGLFFGLNFFVKLLFAANFSMFASSIHISIFRAGRAYLDLITFKKKSKTNNFFVNEKAYIRWYDFLAGIPLGILSLIWW